MTWFGLAWLGLAWLGLAWLGLAWLGLAWLGLAWLGLVALVSLSSHWTGGQTDEAPSWRLLFLRANIVLSRCRQADRQTEDC